MIDPDNVVWDWTPEDGWRARLLEPQEVVIQDILKDVEN